jgi:hypothetical protein
MQRGSRSGNGARVPSSDPTHGGRLSSGQRRKSQNVGAEKNGKGGEALSTPRGHTPRPPQSHATTPLRTPPLQPKPQFCGRWVAPAGGGTVCGPEVRARGATHQGSHCLVCCLELKPKKNEKGHYPEGQGWHFPPCVFLTRRQSIQSPFREPTTLCERKQHPPLALSHRYTPLLPHALPPLPIHSLRHAGNKQEQGWGIVQTGFVFGDQTPRGPCNTTGLY